jgi:HSP20 family protein
MSLIRYRPFSLIDDLKSEFNRMYDLMSRESEDGSMLDTSWAPAVDIKEEADRFLIHADLPGVKPEDIEVHMENGILTLQGSRQEEKKKEGEGYSRMERFSGSFYRRFSLPGTADGENIQAKVKHGVLELVIPKKDTTQPRKITVKSED